MPFFKHVFDGFAALAYPAQCQVCGSTIAHYDDGVACSRCWEDPGITPFFAAPLCHRCGIPLRRSGPATRTAFCGLCDALPISAARACGDYAGALEASVLFLKSQPHICRRLRRLIGATFSDQCEALAADVVVPIPLHSQRRRERGHNQAEVISRVLTKTFEIPLDAGVLVRVKHTERHRIGLDARDRAASVERAFRVARPAAIAGHTVLLVDDVFTTGSTLTSAAGVLLAAGAHRVNVLTIARVPPHSVI